MITRLNLGYKYENKYKQQQRTEQLFSPSLPIVGPFGTVLKERIRPIHVAHSFSCEKTFFMSVSGSGRQGIDIKAYNPRMTFTITSNTGKCMHLSTPIYLKLLF